MIKIEITEILDKALGISKDIKFNVKEFNEKDFVDIKTKELTYLQLGTILMSKHTKIKEVHIIYKE